MNFEEVADTIDEEGSEKLKKYKRHGRPYLVAFHFYHVTYHDQSCQ